MIIRYETIDKQEEQCKKVIIIEVQTNMPQKELILLMSYLHAVDVLACLCLAGKMFHHLSIDS